MQDISVRYDDTLPVPHVLHCFDGYYLAEINPRHRARLPLWLIEIMQNDILRTITTGPHAPLAATPEHNHDNVIDIRPRLHHSATGT